MVFTIGNFITLGIVVLILILYRQLDRNSRNLKLLRDYSEKLKKDLGAFVGEQEKAVKDYGVLLNVERDSARELMKHLQMTEEELAEKAAAMTRIDSQIKSYENSVAELDKMTGRVQENMNRIRDESAFVDAAGKRIFEAKARLDEVTKEIGGLERRFERENAEALERAAEAVTASVKSAVSDLSASAETIERQVEDHRREINKIEAARAANMARDTEAINKILRTALEQAGKRADKMEEAALASLKQQAENRILKLKTAEEERLRNFQENAKARVAEVQNMLKSIRDEWSAERGEWETKDKAWRDARKKELEELDTRFTGSAKQMEDLSVRVKEAINVQEESLERAAEEMKQKALEITGAKLEEYRRAQDAEFRRLETLTDDSRNLDAELRRNMQEVLARAREDFARYERESAEVQKAESAKFSNAAAALKDEMSALEKDLAVLKAAAYDNVSEKLKGFEDDFLSDLAERGGKIDSRLLEWQDNIDARLGEIGEEAEASRRETERELTEEMRRALSVRNEKLVSELDHLKAETSAFEEAIRGRMTAADDAVASYKEQLDRSVEEARKDAEFTIKSEIGKHSIAAAENIKQYQRELDAKLREMSDYIQAGSGEISGLIDASRAGFDEERERLAAKVRELDTAIEDARRRVRDLSSETDSRITGVRSSVEDAERHIREAVDQTKLIDRADAMRLEMERRIEDIKSDMDSLDQRRAEAAQLENEFVKIRRLEDDVNAKMTRFLSEKRRIETMEADFNRLLQISRAVEEKLTQVTSSNDTLEGAQLQIRKLEEALGSAEEKYQRLERKSQALDAANDGIDRNFRLLQESEKTAAKISGDLSRYGEELGVVKTSVEKLAGESEKAKEAADRLAVLDDALAEIEERIKSMQRARQWIADAETRLEELNKNAQIQARAIDAIVKGKGAKALPEPGGTLSSQQKRENILILARMGWKNDEIAKNLKISLAEVELTLEVAPKD